MDNIGRKVCITFHFYDFKSFQNRKYIKRTSKLLEDINMLLPTVELYVIILFSVGSW